MNLRIVAFALCILSLLTQGAMATTTTDTYSPTEKCGVLYKKKDGGFETKFLESLHVITEPSDFTAFLLPTDAPKDVQSVQCGRTSLVPIATDARVLLAGFPLGIVNDNRIGVLEAVNGQIRFRMIQGEITDSEAPLIQNALNDAQDFFQHP